jgi:hypothetical protein
MLEKKVLLNDWLNGDNVISKGHLQEDIPSKYVENILALVCVFRG